MKIRTSLMNGLSTLYKSIQRFPVTTAFAAITAVLVIIIAELDSRTIQHTVDTLIKIAMTTALGVPLTLCIQLLFERNGRSDTVSQLLVWIAGTAIAVLYFFSMLNNLDWTDITRYACITLALILCSVVIPYIPRREHFEQYVIQLSSRFLVTALYSVVLFCGIAAILFTVDRLLSIHVPDKSYYYVWVMIMGIFAPVFYLAGVPRDGLAPETNDYPKLLRILLLHIVIPLIVVYTVILYIYFAKIIATLEWPVGLVSHLVLWYSVISIGVILYTAPIRHENKWAGMFTFWFSKLILPILVMMFISVGIRIDAYGITENRYFVVLLGLWVFGTMCYLTIKKTARNTLILAALASLAVLAIFGPWSAFSIAKSSQNNRLQSILIKYDMIQNNVIIKPSAEISEADKREIQQILNYFSRNHSYSDVKYLPVDFSPEQMETVFGFPYYSWGYNSLDRNEYFSYSTDPENRQMNIKDYDYFFQFHSYRQETRSEISDLAVVYTNENEIPRLEMMISGEKVYEKPLLDLINPWQLPHEKYMLDPDEAMFADENEHVSVKLVIAQLSGNRNVETNDIRVKTFEFYLLIKVK